MTVLAGIAITAAVVVRSGRGRSGVASRDELVRRTFAAVTAGDLDELGRLASYDTLRRKLLECDPGEPRVESELRDALRSAIDRAKGLHADVRSVADGRA